MMVGCLSFTQGSASNKMWSRVVAVRKKTEEGSFVVGSSVVGAAAAAVERWWLLKL
jgi:hypothetical protein